MRKIRTNVQKFYFARAHAKKSARRSGFFPLRSRKSKIFGGALEFLPLFFWSASGNNIFEEVFFMSNKKFAELSRASLDKLNDMQHEITDENGKGVILVAFDRECGGCGGCCH